MKINDIVIVIGSESIPESYLGRYGKIVEISDFKVTVEFLAKVGDRGSLRHTAYEEDLKSIGKAD